MKGDTDLYLALVDKERINELTPTTRRFLELDDPPVLCSETPWGEGDQYQEAKLSWRRGDGDEDIPLVLLGAIRPSDYNEKTGAMNKETLYEVQRRIRESRDVHRRSITTKNPVEEVEE